MLTGQQLTNAIRNLQFTAGLNVTGVLDPETRVLLVKPRCGVPDVSSSGYRNKRSLGSGSGKEQSEDIWFHSDGVSLKRVKRYNLQGERWPRTNLTWSLRRGPSDTRLNHDVVRRWVLLVNIFSQYNWVYIQIAFVFAFAYQWMSELGFIYQLWFHIVILQSITCNQGLCLSSPIYIYPKIINLCLSLISKSSLSIILISCINWKEEDSTIGHFTKHFSEHDLPPCFKQLIQNNIPFHGGYFFLFGRNAHFHEPRQQRGPYKNA